MRGRGRGKTFDSRRLSWRNPLSDLCIFSYNDKWICNFLPDWAATKSISTFTRRQRDDSPPPWFGFCRSNEVRSLHFQTEVKFVASQLLALIWFLQCETTLLSCFLVCVQPSQTPCFGVQLQHPGVSTLSLTLSCDRWDGGGASPAALQWPHTHPC